MVDLRALRHAQMLAAERLVAESLPPELREEPTGVRPHPHLIRKLRHTQRAMRETAQLLRELNAQHADEMDGAANIIEDWIEGIEADAKGENQ